MATKQILTFFEGNQVSKALSGLLLDQSLYLRHETLADYLKDTKISYDPKSLAKVVSFLEKQVYQQIFYFAHLQYHLMQVSDDWGPVGEQQVKLSFFRVLMKQGADQPITDDMVDAFFAQVDENLVSLGIKDLSKASAKSFFETQFVKLLGVEFKTNPGSRISRILRFLGSKYALVSSPYGKGFAYIFGKAVFKPHFDYGVYYISQEVIRSGSFVLANVASVCEHDVMMRYTAFETVFYQKWAQALEPRMVYLFGADAEDFSCVSHAIKSQALALYGVSDRPALDKMKKIFIKEMHETVLFHELGHGITKDYIFPYEYLSIAQGIDAYHKLAAYEGLIEFLSDFSPPTKELFGPMWNMVQVSYTDRKRAERLFYMYLSDVFFYDTEDAHMYDYSDMMCMIMVRYIKKDLSIDFEMIKKDMRYEPGVHEKKSLFEKLAILYKEDCELIKTKVMGIKFMLSEERDFQYVKSLWLEETRKYFKNATDKDPPFLSSFWTNVFSYIDHFAKGEAPGMKLFLEKQCRTVVAKVMILSAGRKVAEQFQFTPRLYLLDRFKKIGLYKK